VVGCPQVTLLGCASVLGCPSIACTPQVTPQFGTPQAGAHGLAPQATLGPIQCNITIFSICTPVCG